MHRTIEFSATLGIYPGYGSSLKDKSPDGDTVNKIIHKWQQFADETHKKFGIYVSCVMRTSVTVYKQEWGCLPDGEYTITIEGAFNPEVIDLHAFHNPELVYQTCVLEIIKKMKTELQQTTVRIIFREVEQVYYKWEEKVQT